MATYRVRVGDVETIAEIDDPTRSQWRGLLLEASVSPAAGPAVVAILTDDGLVERSCEAEVVTPGSDGRTVLAGVTAFTGSTESTSDPRIRSRADKLLAEERVAGTDDPTALAQAVLAESDERQEDREAPGGGPVEHRRSEETVDPTPGSQR
jgi:hypothetical protein